MSRNMDWYSTGDRNLSPTQCSKVAGGKNCRIMSQARYYFQLESSLMKTDDLGCASKKISLPLPGSSTMRRSDEQWLAQSCNQSNASVSHFKTPQRFTLWWVFDEKTPIWTNFMEVMCTKTHLYKRYTEHGNVLLIGTTATSNHLLDFFWFIRYNFQSISQIFICSSQFRQLNNFRICIIFKCIFHFLNEMKSTNSFVTEHINGQIGNNWLNRKRMGQSNGFILAMFNFKTRSRQKMYHF